ncbi:MAG: hypothetical protein ACE5GM_02060, partial [bacterium]
NCWFWGQAAWPSASALAVLSASYRYKAGNDGSSPTVWLVPGILAALIHLLALVILWPVWSAIDKGRFLSRKKKTILVLIVLLFIYPGAQGFPEISFFKISPWQAVQEIIRDRIHLLPLPMGTHRFKLLIGLFGFYGIAGWKNTDRKFLPFLYGAVSLFGLTYFGGGIPLLDSLSPYRFGIPLFFLLIIPAAGALVRYLRLFREQEKSARLAGLTIWLLLIPSFFSGVSSSLAYPGIAATHVLTSNKSGCQRH